jgi:transketolase
MNIDAKNPKKADRDRFVLSKGHATATTYAAMALRGYFPVDELKTFRSIDGRLSGHIEMTHVPGVDMSAGSLGQGISAAVGMAYAAKLDKASWKTYCIVGDGEIQEGQVWEAVETAASIGLDNLRLFVDANKIQLEGRVEDIEPSELPIAEKFAAFGWHTIGCKGHDVCDIERALDEADDFQKTYGGKPVVIIADTVKGKGVTIFENTAKFHGGLPTADQWVEAFKQIDVQVAECEKAVNKE